MATTFFLRTKKETGLAAVNVRVQSAVLGINIRQSTHIKVSVRKWNLAREGLQLRAVSYSWQEREALRKLEDIRLVIDEKLTRGEAVSPGQVRQIIREVLYRECLSQCRRNVPLLTYVDRYIREAEDGVRKTVKGTDFTRGTLFSLKAVRRLVSECQTANGAVYCFNDVGYEFRTMFMDHLYNRRRYNVNTAAKYLNTLITILSAAASEGFHDNRSCLSRQFRARRKDADAIYLTKEELEAFMSVDISRLSRRHEAARDIFMVGVYTAQRVSDYNHITPDNIIRTSDGGVVINLRQKKTGVCVSIPAKAELKRILEKYGYSLPHIPEKALNRMIKEVARAAGIDSPVTIETTSGGVPALETHPKCDLVHSHTARRTGATLMYLAGMNMFNICAVTGHSSIAMLKKYIKADDIDRARTISSDAAFSKW